MASDSKPTIKTTTATTTTTTLTGGCRCRAVRYTVTLPASSPNLSHSFCHCRTRQRISGSAFMPFVGLPTANVTFHPPHTPTPTPTPTSTTTTPSSSALATFAASPHAERRFCRLCGSPIAMVYRTRPGTTSLTTASFDDDGDGDGGAAAALLKLLPAPRRHIFVGERAGWFVLPEDGLAREETMEGIERYLPGGIDGKGATTTTRTTEAGQSGGGARPKL